MAYFYRGDTRHPTEIFEKGFIPLDDMAIYFEKKENTHFAATVMRKLLTKIDPEPGQTTPRRQINYIPDTCSQSSIDLTLKPYAVCCSRHLAAAAMFPLESPEQSSYIYVIDPVDVYEIEMKIYEDSELPKMADNKIFDIHTLQTQQAAYIMDKLDKNNRKYESKDIAWPLHAYEAFASKITTARIVAAIHIERKKIDGETRLSADGKNKINFQVKFRVKSFEMNPKYIPQKFEESHRKNKLTKEIYEMLFHSGLKGYCYTTPSFSYGLGGKTFRNDY